MANSRNVLLAIGVVAILASTALAGCAGSTSGQEKIVIGSPGGWVGEEMRSHMVDKILREELGYETELKENLPAGPIYSSIATGDINVFVGAWLPLQNAHFESQPEGSIVKLGDNLHPDGVTLGLAVPQYVIDAGVTSMADLDAHKEKFGGKIQGIEPGAGMMAVAKERTADGIYGLDDWKIVDASTPAMLAAYDDAVRNKEWIVVMMWSPHFAYTKWTGDQAMVDLEDPGEDVNGETRYLYKDQSDQGRILTLVNKDFEKDFPEAAAFLKNFQITAEQESELMLKVDENSDDKNIKRTVAYEFIDNNPDLVDQWLGR